MKEAGWNPGSVLLGAVLKYAAVHENGRSTSISSLHYFTNLFDEVQEVSTRPVARPSRSDPLWKSEMKMRPRGQNQGCCRSTESESSL